MKFQATDSLKPQRNGSFPPEANPGFSVAAVPRTNGLGLPDPPIIVPVRREPSNFRIPPPMPRPDLVYRQAEPRIPPPCYYGSGTLRVPQGVSPALMRHVISLFQSCRRAVSRITRGSKIRSFLQLFHSLNRFSTGYLQCTRRESSSRPNAYAGKPVRNDRHIGGL